MTFFEELEWRGVVKDISSPDLEEKLNNEKLTFYLGTDPTADSLHIGHYASFVTAKRLARHGHKPIILVGGATGLIGDPRPTAEREIISKETVAKNIVNERNKGKFVSIEDFQSRAKVSGTIVEKLKTIDVLENMPQSSQLSLFD